MESADRFERFTEQAKRVLKLAEEEARAFQHSAIGTEHMLLGVLRAGESNAAEALEALGVTLARLRKAIGDAKGRGSAPTSGEIGFTVHADTALEMAMKEAERQFPARSSKASSPLMGSFHLSESEAAKIEQDGKLPPHMAALGVTLEQVSHALKEAKGRGVLLLFDQRSPINTPADEAGRRHHPLYQVNTGHLLRGILKVPEGTGTKILQEWGVSSIEDVRALMFMNTGTLPLTHREYDLRFTRQAGRAWRLAHEEARRLQDSYVGSTHLLLGLMGAEKGMAASALAEQGLDLARLREQVKPGYDAGDWALPQDIKLQPYLKHIIELAANQARQRSHSSINTGHLLLALVRERDGHGYDAHLLKNLGVDLDSLRARLRRMLAEHGPLFTGEEEAEPEAVEGSDAVFYAAGASIDVLEKGLQSRELDKMMLAAYPFTIEARSVLDHARLSATNRMQPVGPEDLLAGLAYLGINTETRMSEILAGTGVQFANVQLAITNRQEQRVNAAAPILVHSALGRACILLAADEAERRGGPGSPITSEHLLLGLLREERGIIADLLSELGCSMAALRAGVKAIVPGA